MNHMKILKIPGILLIVWGFADLGLSWAGTDLYYAIGIELPDGIRQFSAFTAMGIGYGLYSSADFDATDQE